MPERTGIAPYTSGMAQRLAAEGDEVRLLTTFPHYPEWRFVHGAPPRTAKSSEEGVEVVRLRHRLPVRGRAVSRVRSELSFGARVLLGRWRAPDRVVLVSPAMFSTALLVPRLVVQRIPFVVWVQDLYGLGIAETGVGTERASGLVGRLEAWMLRRADAVVVIHEHMATAVRGLGVPDDAVFVMRNWTHIAAEPRIDRERTRAELGWRPWETVVLHTGNMGAKQDLVNVVRAARLADHRAAPVRFVLMGDGTERPGIESAAVGVERLEIVPSQPQHRYEAMLQAADVLLVNELPGVRGMAFPSKLTSYFASGRPVIAASNEEGTTAAELRASAAGLQVAPGRPSELLDGVLGLASDPDRMRALAAAGQRYRRAELSVEHAVAVFRRVLGGLPVRRTVFRAAATRSGPSSDRTRARAPSDRTTARAGAVGVVAALPVDGADVERRGPLASAAGED